MPFWNKIKSNLFYFDGVSLLAAIILFPAVFSVPIWSLLSMGYGAPLIQPSGWLDSLLRLLLATALTFLGAGYFRWRYGGGVRLRLVAYCLAGGAAVLFVLQVIGVINLIPG